MSSDPPAAPAITPVDLDAIKARVKLAQRMFGVSFDGYPDTDRAPVDIQRDRDRSALLREVERLRAEMAFSRAVKEPAWQPITDEQKTGHRLLVAPVAGFGEESSGVGYWDRDEESEGGQCWRGEYNECIEPPPTAWMRLPRLAAEGAISSPASQLKSEAEENATRYMALPSVDADSKRIIRALLAEVSSPARPDLVLAVKALDAAAADSQPYGEWDAAKWRVFNAAVRFVKEAQERMGQDSIQHGVCPTCGCWPVSLPAAKEQK